MVNIIPGNITSDPIQILVETKQFIAPINTFLLAALLSPFCPTKNIGVARAAAIIIFMRWIANRKFMNLYYFVLVHISIYKTLCNSELLTTIHKPFPPPPPQHPKIVCALVNNNTTHWRAFANALLRLVIYCFQ